MSAYAIDQIENGELAADGISVVEVLTIRNDADIDRRHERGIRTRLGKDNAALPPLPLIWAQVDGRRKCKDLEGDDGLLVPALWRAPLRYRSICPRRHKVWPFKRSLLRCRQSPSALSANIT